MPFLSRRPTMTRRGSWEGELHDSSRNPPRGEHPRARVKRDYLQQDAVEQHEPLEQQQSQESLHPDPHEQLQSSQEHEEPQQQDALSSLAVCSGAGAR